MRETGDRIRIFVEHADPIVAVGVAATLRQSDGFDLDGVDRVTSSIDAAPAGDVRGARAEVVIADYRRSLELASRSRSGSSSAPVPRRHNVIAVTDRDREWDVQIAFESGVGGYLLTGCDLEEMVQAVHAVSRGSRYLCKSVAPRIADSLTRERLRDRETDVLRLVVRGRCNKSIASELDISVGTVKAPLAA